jgi:UDP-N-acetylmuramoylalanine--D-glutamate ligase
VNYSGKTVLIFGLARSGIAAAELLKRHGATVIGVDDSRLPEFNNTNFDFIYTGIDWPAKLSVQPDEIVISPGVPLTHSYLQNSTSPIIGEMELATRFYNGRIIAITGTNGKTTTTELTAHLLKSIGIESVATGNTGLPFSLYADTLSKDSIAVIEVSSFQLETIDKFSVDVAVVLNLAPDHLDRYDTLDDYYLTKRKLFLSAKESGVSITWTSCQIARDWEPPGLQLFGDQESGAVCYIKEGSLYHNQKKLIEIDELGLTGAPNMLNVMASVTAVSSVVENISGIEQGLKSFEPLSHRQEVVAKLGEVKFINDTKATNVHAVCAGLSGFDSPIILIAGGSGKGEDYSLLAEYSSVIKAVVLIGQEAGQIGAALEKHTDCFYADSMNSAVEKAYEVSGGTSAVLLSPACASFDMFTDYADRGRAFTNAANLLQEKGFLNNDK